MIKRGGNLQNVMPKMNVMFISYAHKLIHNCVS